LIYLDTHIVVWLYAGQAERISEKTRNLLDEQEIVVSPIVSLELQYLFDMNRIVHRPNVILSDLANRIGLTICNETFYSIVQKSLDLKWTRDPFDRIIVANAALKSEFLVSKDKTIIENYNKTLF
jgi:PIN domain nuclease of toxin-antitoxin system